MIVVLTILLSINLQLVVGGEGSSDEDESSREPKNVFDYWFIFGNWSGSIYNRSFNPIFPPQEGNGVIYQNYSYIQKNMPPNVVVTLKLISIPNVYNITTLGEYHIQGEKIVAVYFFKKRFQQRN